MVKFISVKKNALSIHDTRTKKFVVLQLLELRLREGAGCGCGEFSRIALQRTNDGQWTVRYQRKKDQCRRRA